MNKTRKMVGVGLAAVVMAGALVYYNFIDKAPTQSTENFVVETYANTNGTFVLDGSKVTLEDQEGKVCVLNFWETWCQACVEELPEFNEFKVAYSEVDIIAIVPKRPDVITWMNGKGYQTFTPDVLWTDFSISFAMYDAEQEDLYAKLGGKGALPMTVVVDKNGVVIYQTEGSMHYEDLQEIIMPLLENTEQTDKDTLQE